MCIHVCMDIYIYIQLNIQPITKALLSGQSNVGVSNIVIITPNENWYPPHIIQWRGFIHAGLTLYQRSWNSRSRFSMCSDAGPRMAIIHSYFQLTRGYYQSTGALVGETMVGLQRVGQIHSCKKTIIPIIPIVCDRLTPLIGTPCMKSISTDEWKKNGNQTWKIPNSTLQWSFSPQFTSMVSGISQRPPGALHETLQGRWSPARAPRCQCCWKNHPPGETRGNLVGFPWNTVNHGIGMIRMG
jgi:hypothetical protein